MGSSFQPGMPQTETLKAMVRDYERTLILRALGASGTSAAPRRRSASCPRRWSRR